MPYNTWSQFCRQMASLLVQTYSSRSHSYSMWSHYNTFSAQDSANLLAIDPWMQNMATGLEIQVNEIPQEFLLGIQHYGAVLQRAQGLMPPIIKSTAVGAVIYDESADRLYYAASGFLPSYHTMPVHPILTAREQRLPLSTLNGVRSSVGTRSPSSLFVDLEGVRERPGG